MGFKKAILVLLLLIILTMGAVSANDNVNNLTAVDTKIINRVLTIST